MIKGRNLHKKGKLGLTMYKTRVVLVLRLFLFVTFAQSQRLDGC